MKRLILTDMAEGAILRFVCDNGSHEVTGVQHTVEQRVSFIKRQIAPYQGAVLYHLAKQYRDTPHRAFVLEIGTAWGYSAAMLAEALPNANIVTLNPKWTELEQAKGHLAAYPHVYLVPIRSLPYLDGYAGPELDLCWVDGDHANVADDLPWYNWMRTGGLMLFHDYSPANSGRPSEPVYEAINDMAKGLGRDPDVLVVDNRRVGMAGFYKREGEQWLTPR